MLNDRVRGTLLEQEPFGRVVATRGIMALPEHQRRQIFQRTANYYRFPKGDDPEREHDFGTFKIEGVTVNWKFDYFGDESCSSNADLPAEPEKIYRVLTIMLADED